MLPTPGSDKQSSEPERRMARYIVCSAFVRNGKTPATGSHDGAVKLWDAATGKEKTTLKCVGEVWLLAVSLVGDVLAVGCARFPAGNNLELFRRVFKKTCNALVSTLFGKITLWRFPYRLSPLVFYWPTNWRACRR